MNKRLKTYIIIFILLLSFVASLFNIKTFNKKYKDNVLINKFILPLITMISFFIACYFVALLISSGEETGTDKYSGIFFLLIVGVILTIFNIYVLSKEKLTNYISFLINQTSYFVRYKTSLKCFNYKNIIFISFA